MNYTFCKVQCHPNCPNLLGWYLKVASGDIALQMDLHLAVTSRYALKVNRDPHNYNKATKEHTGLYKTILNPVIMSANWLLATTNALAKDDILVNENGGWMYYEAQYVRETLITDKFRFPNIQLDDCERITIKRWPQNKHWYLISSQGRLFIPEKTNTLQEAEQIALQFVSKDKITVNEVQEMRKE
jgi:hypothetical protein